MDSVRTAIVHIVRTTDTTDAQAVKKATRNLHILKKSLRHYQTFKKSLLFVDDVD